MSDEADTEAAFDGSVDAMVVDQSLLDDDSDVSEDNEPVKKKTNAFLLNESSDDAGDESDFKLIKEHEDEEEESSESDIEEPKKKLTKPRGRPKGSSSGAARGKTNTKGRKKGKGGFDIHNRPAPIADYQAPNPISSPSGVAAMGDLAFKRDDNNTYRLKAVSQQVEELQQELRDRHTTQTIHRENFMVAIEARETRLEESVQYSNSLVNLYSAIKDENSELHLENCRLSNDLRATNAELAALKKSSANEIGALKKSHAATVASMKETIALLKEQKGELKKKVSKLESNENAVSTLELHQKKKELDVEAHLQKKRNEQLMKEQERESKKKEKSARMSLTSTMAGMAPSGTWNDIVVSYVYNSFLLNVILIL